MVFRKPFESKSEEISNPIEVTSVTGGDTDDTVHELNTKPFEGEIYVMPREFFKPASKQKQTSRLVLTLLIVLFVLFAFGGASLYVFVFQRGSGLGVSSEQDTNVPEEQQPDGSAAETMTTSTEPTTPTIVSTSTPDGDDGSNSLTEDAASFPFIPLLPPSIDIDRDGLTDVEEALIGSDARVPDTDGDSFLDGAELLSGYDPTIPNEKLTEGGILLRYVNDTPSFSLQLPSAWQLSDESTESKKIFFAINGDSVSMELFQNQPPFTLTKWLSDNYPGTEESVFSQTAFGTFTGLEAQNGRQILVNLGSHVALITYDVHGKQEVAYPALWEYILQTLRS